MILPPENYGVRLDQGFDEKEALTDLLRPYPSDEMEVYVVSRGVHRPANNEPSVLEPRTTTLERGVRSRLHLAWSETLRGSYRPAYAVQVQTAGNIEGFGSGRYPS